MTQKHTPSPWEKAAAYSTERGQQYQVRALTGKVVATIAANTDEGTANANLIAAAPDMLTALTKIILCAETVEKGCQSGFEDYWKNHLAKAMEEGRAAIAKARGQS